MSSMQWTVRRLAPSDVDNYKALRLEGFKESSASFSESFEDEEHKSREFFLDCMGSKPEHFTVGAFLSNSAPPVGIATFKKDMRSKARHKSYIHTMYVTPQARGKGAAQALLQFLIAYARGVSGLEQIHLWVLNPETSPAKKLYLKAGFVSQGPVVKKDLIIDGQYVDAEYMTLSL